MLDALATGFAGLAILVALIAARMPIAYAMILVGGTGIAVLGGPAILLALPAWIALGLAFF